MSESHWGFVCVVLFGFFGLGLLVLEAFGVEGLLRGDLVHEVEQLNVGLFAREPFQTAHRLIPHPCDNQIPHKPIQPAIPDPEKLLAPEEELQPILEHHMGLLLLAVQAKHGFRKREQTTDADVLNHRVDLTALERNGVDLGQEGEWHVLDELGVDEGEGGLDYTQVGLLVGGFWLVLEQEDDVDDLLQELGDCVLWVGGVEGLWELCAGWFL